jgi:3-oxoacyl-[acyl-carrier-protein] synthase-1
MSESNDIVITALSALTPVGANAEQSCAAIAAGINRIGEHAYYECTPDDPEWDEPLPLYVSDVPVIDPFQDGTERLLELALPALTELMGGAGLRRSDLENCGLMLALPPIDKATRAMNLASVMVPELCKRTGLTTLKLWKTSQTGNTGVFKLLQSASQKLQDGDVEYCIVGGVDSYLLEERLEFYDAAWRLRSGRNVDGFIPGEAAAMLMLETAQHAKSRGAPILARIGSTGEGMESQAIHDDKHSTGVGLTQAIESVIQTGECAQGLDTVYCSLNGESYFAFEWGVVLTRLGETLAQMKNLVHPADCVGDVGAATGALLLACAASDIMNNTESSPSLLWCSSDSGQRIALSLLAGEG